MMIIYLLVFIYILYIFNYYRNKLNIKYTYVPEKDIRYEYIDNIKKKYNIIFETLTTEDNTKITGVLYNKYKFPSYNDKIFLYFHGNGGWIGSNIENKLIKILSNYGSIFILDYRGYGLSTGVPSESGIYIDTKTTWDFLTKVKLKNPKDIIIIGNSLGTGVATNLCEMYKCDPKAIILQSPFYNFKTLANERFPFGSLLTIYKYDNNKNLKNIKKRNSELPIIIIHSIDDETISINHAIELSKNNNIRLIKINGPHDNLSYPSNLINIINKYENII